MNPDSLAHFVERSITRPRIADTVQLCVGSAVCKRSGELENLFRSAGQSYSANSMPDDDVRGLSPHSKKDGALATEGATLVIGGSHNNTNVNSPPKSSQ